MVAGCSSQEHMCWPCCYNAASVGTADVLTCSLHQQDMLLALLAEDQPLHLAGLGEPATSLIDRMPRVCVRLFDAHMSLGITTVNMFQQGQNDTCRHAPSTDASICGAVSLPAKCF